MLSGSVRRRKGRYQRMRVDGASAASTLVHAVHRRSLGCTFGACNDVDRDTSRSTGLEKSADGNTRGDAPFLQDKFKSFPLCRVKDKRSSFRWTEHYQLLVDVAVPDDSGVCALPCDRLYDRSVLSSDVYRPASL